MKRRLIIMRPKLLLAAAGLSLLLALPVSLVLKQRDNEIQSQRRISHDLRLQLDNFRRLKSLKPTPVAKQAARQLPAPITPPAPKPIVKPLPPPVIVSSYHCEAWASDFERYNWNVATAMAICQAESSGDANAVGCGNYDGVCDFGLMQLHGEDILNPAANISYAYYDKYLTQGWGAWTSYTSGKYLQYL